MINTAVNRPNEATECLFASIVSAFGQVLTIQPALRIQTYMQINGTSFERSARVIANNATFYRGFLSTYVMRSVMYGSKFPVLPAFKDENGNISLLKLGLATIAMTTAESVTAAPIDSIRVQTGLANSGFITLSGGIKHIAAQTRAQDFAPLKRLYTGFIDHFMMNGVSNIFLIGGYRAFDSYSTNQQWSTTQKDSGRFSVGFIAGIFSVSGAPFEQMRNRKIAMSFENKTITYSEVIQSEGATALMRGWAPKMIVKAGGTGVLTLLFPKCLDAIQYGVDFATHSSSTHRKHPKYMHPLIDPMHIFVDAYQEEASLESLRSTTQTRQETTILSKRGFFAERFMERFADFLIHNCSTESLSAGTSLSDRKY